MRIPQRNGRRMIGGVAGVVTVAAACTRAPQPVAADRTPTAVPEATQAVDGAPPTLDARGIAASRAASRRYLLPAGCVPPGKKFACNPVSNDGCNQESGEACDDDTKGGFTCYPPPNEVDEDGDCNDKEGPSCAPGLSCDTPGDSHPDGVCRRLCCTAADCSRAQAKRCVPVDPEYGTFGFCK